MLGGFLFICPFFVLNVNLCEKKPMCISEALSQQIFVGFEDVCLQQVFTVTIFRLPKHRDLEDAFQRRLEDILEEEKLLR